MRLKRGKTGDAMGRPNWRSSFLGDAGATFFCKTEQTGYDALEIPAPRSALRPKRIALRAPQGFAPDLVRELSGKQENQQTSPTSSEINLLQQKNGQKGRRVLRPGWPVSFNCSKP